MFRIFPLILVLFSCQKPAPVQNIATPMKQYSFLALGDSYTIGESVPTQDNFPNQIVQLLKNDGLNFTSPEIVAKTGWTTDELQTVINAHTFLPRYDFVTLLIGVNNQYRGRTVDNYKPEFENLLKQAIQFASNDTNHVTVISIPDWGSTPFAASRDRVQIAKEIDDYNAANKQIAAAYKINYIDIDICK